MPRYIEQTKSLAFYQEDFELDSNGKITLKAPISLKTGQAVENICFDFSEENRIFDAYEAVMSHCQSQDSDLYLRLSECSRISFRMGYWNRGEGNKFDTETNLESLKRFAASKNVMERQSPLSLHLTLSQGGAAPAFSPRTDEKERATDIQAAAACGEFFASISEVLPSDKCVVSSVTLINNDVFQSNLPKIITTSPRLESLSLDRLDLMQDGVIPAISRSKSLKTLKFMGNLDQSLDILEPLLDRVREGAPNKLTITNSKLSGGRFEVSEITETEIREIMKTKQEQRRTQEEQRQSRNATTPANTSATNPSAQPLEQGQTKDGCCSLM